MAKAKKESPSTRGWQTRRANAVAKQAKRDRDLATEGAGTKTDPVAIGLPPAKPSRKKPKPGTAAGLAPMVEHKHRPVDAPFLNYAVGGLRRADGSRVVPTEAADPIGEFVVQVLLAARKKGGAAAVGQMLNQRIVTERSNAADVAWRRHRGMIDRERRSTIEQVIADFLTVNMMGPDTKVICIGRTTLRALVDVLTEAGYTSDGKRTEYGGHAFTDMESDLKAAIQKAGGQSE